MQIWQNLPLVLIVGSLMCAVICSVLRGRAARGLMTALAGVTLCAMGVLLYFTYDLQISYVYPMGEIGAPFGNELRIGVVESLTGLGFSLVIFLSVLGGRQWLISDVPEQKMNLYAAMVCLLNAAMCAMVFTNDLFTSYVFIEITTIAACALIMSTNRGRTMYGAARYMLMNLLGSGLFLLGLSIMYCLTGHLLFPQLQETVLNLLEEKRYLTPLNLSFVLMTLGIAIKSALYPFHTWLPNAYASTTAASSALLSSLISKMYIFLLIKIVFRANGFRLLEGGMGDVLFLFAVVGVVMGSVDALREHHVSRMVAYSSVAQIGYIFLGVSLGTEAGMAAALFHIQAHAAAKSMLFLSCYRLRQVSGGDGFRDVEGSAYLSPLAGIAFAAGACSLVGVPLLGGFSSKVFLAQAGIQLGGWHMIALLAALAVSTVLNALYMLRTAAVLYRHNEKTESRQRTKASPAFAAAMIALIAWNIFLGLFGRPVMAAIQAGIQMFA